MKSGDEVVFEQAIELPEHVYETVHSMAELYARTYKDATPQQRLIEAITRRLGRPAFVIATILFTVVWVIANLTIIHAGRRPIDSPPFPLLQTIVSVCALVMTTLIITAENRLGQIEERRARLALQLNLLTEHKVAKIIALLEELRRDDPRIPDHDDPSADAMKEPVDAQAVFAALEETHEANGPPD